MKKSQNTKGYGTLKKAKGLGLVGVLMLFGTVSIAGSQVAYADDAVEVESEATFDLTASLTEVATEAEVTEIVADETTVAEEAEVATEEATKEAETVVIESGTTTSLGNETKATVTHDTVSSTEARSSVTIETKVTEQVKEGQFVEYTLTNLPTGGLKNKEITVADGTVIGQIEVVSEALPAYNEEQNNQLDNNGEHDQALSTADMNKASVIRVVFNKQAEQVVDIAYKFGFTNQYFAHFISTAEYAYVSKISIGGNMIAEETVDVPAYGKTPIKSTTVSIQSPYNSVVSADNGLKLTQGQFTVGLYNSVSQPIKAGATITVKVNGTALVTLTDKEGSVITEASQRGYYDDSVVNDNNIILNDLEHARFEVLSNDGETLVLKALNNIEKTNKFGITLKASYTPSRDEISKDGSRIIGINNTELTVSDENGGLIYTTVRSDDYANIRGNDITAEAAFTGKLVVRHVSTTGKVLKEETPVAGKEGEAYTTSASNFEGYTLVKSTDNTSGQFTRGTITVVYTYASEQKVPGDAPSYDLPEAELPVEQKVPGDAPTYDLPEADIPVVQEVPGNPPTYDLPRYEVVCIPVTYCETYTYSYCVPVTRYYRNYCGYCVPYTYYVRRTETRTRYVTKYRQEFRLVTRA